MATKPNPVPRKWNNARRNAIRAAMDGIDTLAPVIKKRAGPLETAQALGEVVYQLHYIVDQLTSVPAEDERTR